MSAGSRRMPTSAHLGYLFTEMPLVDRFAAAGAAGFRFVEHPSPYALSASEVRSLCETNHLRVAQIALPAGQAEGADKGLASLPGREAEFAEALDRAVAYAEAIGCRMIHPMSGATPYDDPRALWKTYVANLATACAAAAAAGLVVIIEPIGQASAPGYFMHDPQLALRAISEVGAPNLRLCLDAYHAARAGVDVAGFVREHGSLIAHVQVADDPGRHEPGAGGIDFAALFGALWRTEYEGSIGLEYVPRTTTDEGLGWIDRYKDLIEPLRPIADEKKAR